MKGSPRNRRSNNPASAVHEWLADHVDDLVDLARALIQFDTQCVEPSVRPDATNEEGKCQTFIRQFLANAGFEVTEVSPDPTIWMSHPMMPVGHNWNGRAMTVAV